MSEKEMARSEVREPTVLDPLDPGSAALFTGLPYATQGARDGDDRLTSASLTWSDPAGVPVLAVPGLPERPISCDRVALNRALAGTEPRPMPPPRRGLVVSARSLHRSPEGLDDPPAGLPMDFMDLGEKPLDWAALIGRARNSRVTLVDSAGFEDPLTLARIVVALAGAGTLCALAPWGPSVRWLDPEFLTTLRVDLEAVVADDLEWAAALARQTRSAWLGHDVRLAWDSTGGGWEPRIRRVPMPSISLLFASKRPPLVEPALHRIAAQSSVIPEVILALHGCEDPDVDAGRAAMSRLGLSGQCFAVDETVPLGAVLNVAAERSSGTHLAKWDDDDFYGPHHLEDLVVAMRRSGADLVGKGAEFVHFEATGETILRKTKNAEARSRFIAGAAMMIRRDVFFDAGGFPPLTHSVDYHLKERLLALGHDYFRTHGFGFVMARMGSGHTREVSGEVLRSQAERTWQGIPSIAGVIA